MTIAEAGAAGAVRHFGTIGGDLEAVAKLLRRLRRKGRDLRFVYEAGPYGLEIYRFQAMRSIDTIAAITLVTELGDFTRFDPPRKLMAFLGPVPFEHSSGSRRRLGRPLQ